MKKIVLVILGLSCFVFLQAQIQIDKIEIVPSECSDGGKVILEISGGVPFYCYRIDGGICQFSDQTTHTFDPVGVGSHQISVSDANDSIATIITMNGLYSPLEAICSVDGCAINIEADKGKAPYTYAISINGAPFGATQSTPYFDQISGDFCVDVVDDCGNSTQCCGFIEAEPLTFAMDCCEDNNGLPPNQFCAQIKDTTGNIPSDQNFRIGGVPPYTYSAFRNGQYLTSQDGRFTLDADCPAWTFRVEDACGNSVQQEFSCISASATCLNCAAGTATLTPLAAEGLINYYVLSDTGWQVNPNGINNPSFNNLSNILSGLGYVFYVEDACGQVSDSIILDCFSAEASYNCVLNEIVIEPISEYFPVEVTCTSCVPNQTTQILLDEKAGFTISSGFNTFELRNDCGDVLDLRCRDTVPRLLLRRSCNSIEAVYQSGYVCDGYEPNYQVISEDIVYALYLESNPTSLLESNTTGLFFDLLPGVRYIVEAVSPDCGIATKSIQLFPSDSHNLTFDLTPSSILDGAVCRKSFTLKVDLDKRTNIKPKYALFGGSFAFDSVDVFSSVMPGTWVLASENYCDTINITLPEWETDMSIELPRCSSNPCVQLEGMRNVNKWSDWGAQYGFSMKAKSDFYTFNCSDKTDPDCEVKTVRRFCNYPYDSTQYIYLHPREGTCPVDTLIFSISIDDFEDIDSLYIPAGITCNSTDAVNLELQVFGGTQPISSKIINAQTNQVIASFDDVDEDFLIEFSNLYSQIDYKAIVTDACKNVKETPFRVFALPNVVADYTFLCDGNVQLFTPGIPSASFEWIDPSGVSMIDSIGAFSLILPTPDTVSTFSTEISIAQCPPHLTSIEVPVFYFPEVSLPTSDTLLCRVDSFHVRADVGFGNYTYAWSSGQDSLDIVIDSTGTYTVIATNEFNCPDTATIRVGISTLFDTDIQTMDNICYGEHLGSIDVQVRGGVEPILYNWEHGPNDSSIENLQAGMYKLTITDSLLCNEVHSVWISEPNPFSMQLPVTVDLLLGEEVFLEPNINGNPAEPIQWDWTPTEQVSCPSCLNTIIQPLSDKSYLLTGTDANGCKAQSAISFDVDESCTAVIPNALSLRSDSYNSFMRLFAAPCIQEVLSFDLYDRWGNSIVNRSNFQPQNEEVLWDGRFQNRAAIPGVYLWVLQCKLVGGATKTWTGDISVLD